MIVRTGRDTDGNPAPVLDRETGIVWLLFCKNFADGAENLIVEGKAPRTVWVTCSRDEGESWEGPRRDHRRGQGSHLELVCHRTVPRRPTGERAARDPQRPLPRHGIRLLRHRNVGGGAGGHRPFAPHLQRRSRGQLAERRCGADRDQRVRGPRYQPRRPLSQLPKLRGCAPPRLRREPRWRVLPSGHRLRRGAPGTDLPGQRAALHRRRDPRSEPGAVLEPGQQHAPRTPDRAPELRRVPHPGTPARCCTRITWPTPTCAWRPT